MPVTSRTLRKYITVATCAVLCPNSVHVATARTGFGAVAPGPAPSARPSTGWSDVMACALLMALGKDPDSAGGHRLSHPVR